MEICSCLRSSVISTGTLKKQISSALNSEIGGSYPFPGTVCPSGMRKAARRLPRCVGTGRFSGQSHPVPVSLVQPYPQPRSPQDSETPALAHDRQLCGLCEHPRYSGCPTATTRAGDRCRVRGQAGVRVPLSAPVPPPPGCPSRCRRVRLPERPPGGAVATRRGGPRHRPPARGRTGSDGLRRGEGGAWGACLPPQPGPVRAEVGVPSPLPRRAAACGALPDVIPQLCSPPAPGELPRGAPTPGGNGGGGWGWGGSLNLGRWALGWDRCPPVPSFFP